jgi:hypothetical protein
VYVSREIGLFVVLVARKRAVNLYQGKSLSDLETTERGDSHDILGVPVHYCVFKVETFKIADSGGLDFFGKAKMTA